MFLYLLLLVISVYWLAEKTKTRLKSSSFGRWQTVRLRWTCVLQVSWADLETELWNWLPRCIRRGSLSWNLLKFATFLQAVRLTQVMHGLSLYYWVLNSAVYFSSVAFTIYPWPTLPWNRLRNIRRTRISSHLQLHSGSRLNECPVV